MPAYLSEVSEAFLLIASLIELLLPSLEVSE